MQTPSIKMAIIMERRLTSNRWVPVSWSAKAILLDAEPGLVNGQLMSQESDATTYFYGGFALALQRDEAENYFLNIGGTDPKVFVMWRLEDDIAKPCETTVSFGEAARWMDSGESVDGIAMPHEIAVWVSQFVEQHYQPEVKRPRKRDVIKEQNGG